MTYFFYKLIGPRPTFPYDATEAEWAIMEKHFTYWRQLLADRTAVVYGPVPDPAGTFGMAVLEVEDEAAARRISDNDPTIVAQAGFSFELYPMPDALARS